MVFTRKRWGFSMGYAAMLVSGRVCMSSRLQCAFHSSQAQQLHQPKIAVPERHFHELRTGFDKITAVISNDIKTWAATISPRVVQISPQRMDPWIRYMFLHENHITSTIQM